MKLKFILLLVLVTLVALCSGRPAEEEYADYEEGAEPAPPPKKVPARTPLVGRRNPLAGRNNKPGASSTTTTTAAPSEEEAAEEEDYVEEQPAETSSTTEAPKKIIKTGVRPFRSNDDLLATLKRRREQVASNKHAKPVQADPEEPAASAPVEKETPKSSKSRPAGRKNRFSKDKAEPVAAAAEETSSTAAPARTGRRFNSRS